MAAMALGGTPVVLWSAPLIGSNNATFGTPTLFGDSDSAGILVFGVDVARQETWVFALRAADGATLWKTQTPFVEAFSGWVETGPAADGTPLAYAGVNDGVIALFMSNGSIAWRFTMATQGVSAHPTYFNGLIFVAFENGPQSSPLITLDATTGKQLWATTDLAFSKIWSLPPCMVVYMSYTPGARGETGVAVAARTLDGLPAWNVTNLTTTGLNNNPNLDVDVYGSGVYMYSKPEETLRYITLFASINGAQLWNLSTVGEVDDYDTYAWNRNFYRLVSQNPNTFLLHAVDSNRDTIWRTFFSSTDMNAILLVGGGGVFVFCPDTNLVYAFDAATGTPLWELNVLDPNDGIAGSQGVLFFGDGEGQFHAVRVQPA